MRRAPLNRDVYAHLPKAQRNAWEYWDGRSINETLATFAEIPVDLTISIRLIGFDGDGINNVRLSEAELLKYLRALHLDLPTAVLEPAVRHMSVVPRVHWEVHKASPTLTHRLAGVLTAAAHAAQAAAPTRPHTYYLPHDDVDRVIAEEEDALDAAAGGRPPHLGRLEPADHGSAAAGARPAFTLYLLNLEPPSRLDYLYTYGEQPEVAAMGNWSEFRSCPGALWVAPRPYAWVDLAAAPHAYGPLRGGQGQVFPHSLPHAASYLPALAATAMLPDIAALAASAVRHLAWPPLAHAGVGGEGGFGRAPGEELTIEILHIHDTLGIPARSVRTEELETQLSALAEGGAGGVIVREAYISFAACDLCVNAYNNALRVRTRRRDGSAVGAAAGQVLDRLALHASMSEYAEIILAYAGVAETRRVLPVFVFDLSHREEPLLLDGELQAAAFPDMVLAVASRAGPVRTRHSCGHARRTLQPEDATRAVLAGVLTAAYSVPHTALRYHPASGPGWAHLWAVGATPFGDLSGLGHLSAAQAGAAGRNAALAALEGAAGRIEAVLRGLSRLSPSGRWQTAVPRRDLLERLRGRLNAAAYKLRLAAAALGQGRHAEALRLATLLGPDASALESAAAKLAAGLTPALACGGSGGGSHWGALLVPPAGGLVALAGAVWWRGRGARRREEARYDKMY